MSVTSGAAKLRNHYKHLVYLLYRFCIAFYEASGRWSRMVVPGESWQDVALGYGSDTWSRY
jgi:hypothetical protein